MKSNNMVEEEDEGREEEKRNIVALGFTRRFYMGLVYIFLYRGVSVKWVAGSFVEWQAPGGKGERGGGLMDVLV